MPEANHFSAVPQKTVSGNGRARYSVNERQSILQAGWNRGMMIIPPLIFQGRDFFAP